MRKNNKKYKKVTILLLSIVFFVTIMFFVFLIFGEKDIVLTLSGKNMSYINYGENYKEEGYKAIYCNKYIKIFCKDITQKVTITEKNKTNISYSKVYNINFNGMNKTIERKILIVDKESPEIELVNSDLLTCPNKEYVEEGYNATDNVDGNITDKVIATVEKDKVTYTVEDSSGNKKTIVRNVKYGDNESPKISLIGDETINILLNNDYIEPGYNATDNCDKTVVVTTNTNLNTNKVGDYTVNYEATDSSGNKSIAKRNIRVIDSQNIEKNGKVVYITFDDGPGPYTKDILNILDKYNVKVTFFVTNQFSNYVPLIKDEFEKGHTIAVHTATHNFDKVYQSVDNYLEDFNSMNQIIYQYTGNYTKMFRFPGGSSNTASKFNPGIVTRIAKKMTDLGYIYYDWNVDSMDTSTSNSKTIANNVINDIAKHDYSIVLMHDIKKANIASIDEILSEGILKGYTFLPLTEASPTSHHRINN